MKSQSDKGRQVIPGRRCDPSVVSTHALVVKSVDTLDLKSNAAQAACQFKSGRGHHRSTFRSMRKTPLGAAEPVAFATGIFWRFYQLTSSEESRLLFLLDELGAPDALLYRVAAGTLSHSDLFTIRRYASKSSKIRDFIPRLSAWVRK